MYDILVNGNMVGVVAPSVAKLFAKALVDALDMTFQVEVRVHGEEPGGLGEHDAPAETKKEKK